MPKGLCIDNPQSIALRECEDAPLAEDQLRIRTEIALIKHGTAFRLSSDRSPLGGRYVVTETGAAVTRFRMGDRVYSGQAIEVRWLQVLHIGVKDDTNIRYSYKSFIL